MRGESKPALFTTSLRPSGSSASRPFTARVRNAPTPSALRSYASNSTGSCPASCSAMAVIVPAMPPPMISALVISFIPSKLLETNSFYRTKEWARLDAVSSERAKLVEEVLLRSRELSTETVMFHTAISETRGLSAVDSKVLDYLARFGPQTPKDLARLSGLAPASMPAMIDRQERKGIVTHEPHPDDRRKILISL